MPLASVDTHELDALLVKTSRTFALSIPLLPEPARTEVGIAYLLFRIADTFEDAVAWPPERRVRALEELAALLARDDGDDDPTPGWLEPPSPIAHDGYQELLAAAPRVLAAYRAIGAHARHAIGRHLRRSALGMAAFVRRGDAAGRLQLDTFGDLHDYCYTVAGIVGEMLTDIFLLEVPALAPVANALGTRAADFGEALQLVNILKDAGADATEGRTFLPPDVERSTVFTVARNDLRRAGEYIAALQEANAPRGLVAFCALPVLLAAQSLDRIERAGTGARITRGEVMATVAALDAALDRGEPIAPMLAFS